MPTYGGLSPGFERYGGTGTGGPTLKRIVDSIGSQRGTAYDVTPTSNVYAENMAFGRAIAECWSNNNRMSNQWDSARMSEFLPRWEKILGLIPSPTDTPVARRTRVAASFSRITQSGIYQTVYDQMLALLGSSIFIGITNTSSASASVWTPAGWSVGSHDPAGLQNFTSTVAHILIQVTQPSSMADGVFYQTLGVIEPVLDTLLPAWVTWDWARNASVSSALHVVPILSSTNASPIVVTTSPPYGPSAGAQHGFVVGQTVTIAGHLVNTAANGTWVISAIGGTTAGGTGTTLTLTGSTGNGVGGATGTVVAIGFYLDGDPSIGGTSGTLVNLDNEALTT